MRCANQHQFNHRSVGGRHEAGCDRAAGVRRSAHVCLQNHLIQRSRFGNRLGETLGNRLGGRGNQQIGPIELSSGLGYQLGGLAELVQPLQTIGQFDALRIAQRRRLAEQRPDGGHLFDVSATDFGIGLGQNRSAERHQRIPQFNKHGQFEARFAGVELRQYFAQNGRIGRVTLQLLVQLVPFQIAVPSRHIRLRPATEELVQATRGL